MTTLGCSYQLPGAPIAAVVSLQATQCYFLAPPCSRGLVKATSSLPTSVRPPSHPLVRECACPSCMDPSKPLLSPRCLLRPPCHNLPLACVLAPKGPCRAHGASVVLPWALVSPPSAPHHRLGASPAPSVTNLAPLPSLALECSC